MFVAISTMLTGCVLTSDQKDAVKQFAGATNNFGTLPSSALSTFDSAYVTDHWTLGVQWVDIDSGPLNEKGQAGDDARAAAAKILGGEWQSSLINNRQLTADLDKQVDKASAAFKVLDTYSNLLTQLTSDDYTNSLDANATALSGSLDNAIELYNSKANANVSPIGATVAEIIRGAGGIYIRVLQERALKAAIPKADPAVQTITCDVTATMDGLNGLITHEEGELQDAFVYDSINSYKSGHGPLSAEMIASFAAQLEKLETARNLAAQASESAVKYGAAHKSLVAAINQPASFKTALADIAALKVEVQAAQKLKTTLDAANAAGK